MQNLLLTNWNKPYPALTQFLAVYPGLCFLVNIQIVPISIVAVKILFEFT